MSEASAFGAMIALLGLGVPVFAVVSLLMLSADAGFRTLAAVLAMSAIAVLGAIALAFQECEIAGGGVHCGACSYDLRGLPPGPCPECGHPSALTTRE